MSYTDREGSCPERGDAIQVRTSGEGVSIAMGVMRNFGSLFEESWALLTLDEADELADDLRQAARKTRNQR